jgi:hypothetical protein
VIAVVDNTKNNYDVRYVLSGHLAKQKRGELQFEVAAPTYPRFMP